MRANAKVEAEVLAVLQRYAEAYTRRDLDGVLALFAPDPDLVLIGTGADEKRTALAGAREQFERDWSQSEAMFVEFRRVSVSAAGAVAWLAADLDVRGMVEGREMHIVGRFTAVLEQRGDRWWFVQAHFSLPYGAQLEGQSWPTSIETVLASVQAERPDLAPHSAPDGTVTILFSDIEDSTAMTERVGDLRWMDVVRAHNAIIREQLARHGGYEVKSEGDGFMLAFQSARRALHCAIDTQRALARYNTSADEPIRVRMGLHAGEVVREGDDFFGKHVILASRVAGEARGGQILVSSLLKELTESGGDVRFGESREVELKGLAGSHRLFEAMWTAS